MAKIILRLGAVIPLTENLDVGEPVWDANKAALGVGNGEKNPRFYPGIKQDSSLKLIGRKLISPDSDSSYVIWNTNGYSIYWNNKESIRIDNTGVNILTNLTTSGENLIATNKIPLGGNKGQVLAKNSGNDGDLIWINPPAVSNNDAIDGGTFF